MGKKYLIEVEERNDEEEKIETANALIFSTMFMALPPLIAILSVVRGSCFDEKKERHWGAAIAGVVMGFIWSIILLIFFSVKVALGDPSFVNTKWVISLSVTCFVMYLVDLIIALVTMSRGFSATAKKVLVVLICIAFIAGILTTILLGI